MSRGQRFFKKTLIYTIGSFGSKFLTFLLLPLYTYLISISDYGYYDLIITTVSLAVPLITLQTQESIITGMLADEYDDMQIIKSTLNILIVNSLIAVILVLLINCVYKIRFIEYIVLIIICKSFSTIVQQYCRGLKNSKLYAFSGFLYTLIFLSLNVYQLIILKNGIRGLFISEIFASFFMTIYIILREKNIFKALFQKLDRKILKWIILFSLPLVPNALSWWIINASDRYVINFFMGSSANGIYAISYKFANILQTITGLVYLAWQEMSLDEYNSDDKDIFLSSSFNIYSNFLLTISIIGFCFTKYIVCLTMAPAYQDSWLYTGWLFLGTSFIALSSFLNTGYLVNNRTSQILKGTLIAGIINIVIDMMLINYIGIYAASFSTAISSFVLIILRIRDNKAFYKFNVDMKSFLFLTVLSSIIFISTSFYREDWFIILCLLIGIISFVYFNKKLIKSILRFLYLKFGGTYEK